jgi:ubiquinone/menaquinone biosynthesis C-methylase UbiE
MQELKWTGERLVTSVNNIHGVIEHLHRYAIVQNIVSNKIVLDIASGEGYGSFLISKQAKKVIGVDIDEKSINHAKEKYKNQSNLFFKIGNGISIPLEDKIVDVVISFETIEHIFEQEVFVKEIRRVLKDDGILIISSPEKSIYSERDKDNPFHLKELTKIEFNFLLSKYFVNVIPLAQRYFIGSLIHMEDLSEPVKFAMFSGDYTNIESGLKIHQFYNKPYFNISIASNVEIDKSILINSVFSGFEPIDNQLSILKTRSSFVENSRVIKLYFNIRRFLTKFFDSI